MLSKSIILHSEFSWHTFIFSAMFQKQQLQAAIQQYSAWLMQMLNPFERRGWRCKCDVFLVFLSFILYPWQAGLYVRGWQRAGGLPVPAFTKVCLPASTVPLFCISPPPRQLLDKGKEVQTFFKRKNILHITFSAARREHDYGKRSAARNGYKHLHRCLLHLCQSIFFLRCRCCAFIVCPRFCIDAHILFPTLVSGVPVYSHFDRYLCVFKCTYSFVLLPICTHNPSKESGWMACRDCQI